MNGTRSAMVELALHEIEDKRGPQRESVQVFREFYAAIKAIERRQNREWLDAALDSLVRQAENVQT